jgi:hypothetical protein
MTSTGDLLRIVGRIEQMIKSQHNKYKKVIASSKHTTKFQHKLESMPFLPRGIHDVLTPPAIERIRQQDLLRQKEQRQRRSRHPCSGLFERTNGLPCRHTLQEVSTAGSTLRLNHLYDDHWRYQREHGPSVRSSSRPYQSVLEPLTAQTRGAPRRNEASTRRDHQLSNEVCHLLFLAFSLTMNPKVKHLLKLCSKSALLSLFRFLPLHQIQVL